MMAVGFLIERFQEHQEKPAFLWNDSEYSYGWLVAAVANWVSILRSADVKAGTVVSLKSGFWPEAVAAFLGLAQAKCIVVPISESLAKEGEKCVELAQSEIVIELERNGDYSLSELGCEASHPLYDELRHGGTPGLVLFTSGSSGQPKAVVHDLSCFLGKFRTRRHDLRTLAFLLFDHVGGLDTLFYCLANTSSLVLVEDRRPRSVCRAVEKHRVEVLPTTPSFLNLLIASEAYKEFSMSSLKYLTYGAEMMPAITLRKCREILPSAVLVQKYGTTEFGALRSRSENSRSLWVQLGGEGCKTRVVDGILEVKAESSMLGYLNAPDPFTEDGWISTGDLVAVRGSFFRFLGTEAEVINVGGQKVYPAEVENAIRELEEIVDVVVFGEENLLLGNIVCAALQVKEGSQAQKIERAVKRHCRNSLEEFKVPMRVSVSESSLVSLRQKKLRSVRRKA